MSILLDANVLLRLADATNAAHAVAAAAVATLRAQGETLGIVPQSVYEFWVVATRPIANNGLGLSSGECLRELPMSKRRFRSLMTCRPCLLNGKLSSLFSHATGKSPMMLVMSLQCERTG